VAAHARRRSEGPALPPRHGRHRLRVRLRASRDPRLSGEAPALTAEHEREAAALFAGWADLFAPMIPPDRYRLLLQLGRLGLVADEQARELAALWRSA
jgi:hypothetical protein